MISSSGRRAHSTLRPLCVSAVAVLAILGPATSRAEPGTDYDLKWEAPATCPSAEHVRNRVRQLLGPNEARWRSVALAADGVVVVVDGKYRLNLTVHLGDRSTDARVFDSPSCDSLAGAAAVMLALLLRGDAGLEPKAAPAAVPPSAAVPTPRAPEKTRKPASYSLLVDAPSFTVDSGVLPFAGYGVGAGVGIHVGRLEIKVAGSLWLDQNATLASEAYHGTFVRQSGEVFGCYSWRRGPFDVGPCLLARVENVVARGSGPDIVSRSGHATWLALGAAVQARWFLNDWAAIFVAPSAAISTSHPAFTLDGVGVVHRVSFGRVSATLGWEWVL